MPLPEIEDCSQLQAEISRYESGTDLRPEMKRYLVRRSIELGCTEHIPDKWEMEARNERQ